MLNIESFYFADTAHILTCMPIDKFKCTHTHTLLPKLSRVTLGCSHTLLHTQPPRIPTCPLIPYMFPYTPTFIYTHTHTHTPSHSLARTCTITDLETHVTCLLPWQPSDDGGAPPRSPFCSPAYVSPCTWVLTRLVHRSLIPTILW